MGSRLETPDLGGINPGNGCKGQGVDDDQEVAKRNDRVGWRPFDKHHDIFVAPDSFGHGLPVATEHSCDYEMTDGHPQGTPDEKRAAARAINKEEPASDVNYTWLPEIPVRAVLGLGRSLDRDGCYATYIIVVKMIKSAYCTPDARRLTSPWRFAIL